jgi:hypothetical protein
MSLESGLVAILDNANTTAGTRVYPILLPESPTFPAITYQEISQVPQNHRDGNSGLDRARTQINCWGKTFEQARVLANEIRALNGSGSGEVTKLFVEDAGDDFDEGTELFLRRLDLVIWHRRA